MNSKIFHMDEDKRGYPFFSLSSFKIWILYKDKNKRIRYSIETNTTLGSVTVYPDTTALQPFQLNNCVLMSVQETAFDGNQAGLVIRLRGVYLVNSTLFAAS